jgi:NAD(P)H-dependent flavin oxidoreductase YrpB (nitropropane dioxygenase family)
MTEKTPARGSISAPMASWVKNGSTSGKHDKWMAQKLADANKRRAEEDKKFALAKAAPNEAKIRQHKLGGRKEHPVAVLGLRHSKDHTVNDWMICEITEQSTQEGKLDLMLMMQCPRCILTYGRPPEETIMHIRQSNRMWHLDRRTKAERSLNAILHSCAGEIFVNPEEPTEVVVVAGMVTTDDWCKCPLCGWTFRINDSVVYTQ